MIRLEIDPFMFGLTLVVFLLLIAVLNSWLYRPMLAYMEARDASIKKDLDEAGNNDAEIKDLEEKAQNIVEAAKAEAAALRQKVLEDAKLLASSKIEAKRNELEKEYQTFTESLLKERETIKTNLLSQAPLFKEALKAKFSQI